MNSKDYFDLKSGAYDQPKKTTKRIAFEKESVKGDCSFQHQGSPQQESEILNHRVTISTYF
jgi:hypothetical protein